MMIPRRGRPFDADRDGSSWEGAGILILEALEHATQRNACSGRIVLEYRRRHITQPVENGDGRFA
jgi:3-oxoacyl-(acyl-carrier-protein) synthase